jgi:hypothetical protein
MLIVAAFMALPLLSIIPVSATITGKPTLYVVTTQTGGTGDWLIPGTLSDGATIRTHINSYDAGDLVVINITGMTITGAQVWIYISETGGAVIETGDIWYAGPFQLSSITASVPTQNYTKTADPKTGQKFWLGNYGIIGPIPAGTVVPRGANYYVKIIDVNPTTPSIPSSDVAVSVNQWKPYESISIAPTKGPVGTTVAVTGMAWDSSKKVNVTYSAGATDLTPVVIALVIPAADGTFSSSFVVPDSKLFNANVTMYVNAYYNGTASVLSSKSYTENRRRWLQVNTYLGMASAGGNGYTNGQVKVSATIYISAIFANPGGTVNLLWDYNLTSPITLASGIAVDANGFFNVSVTVPITQRGWHRITMVDKTYNMNASVDVIPTLVLSPTSGPIATTVSANGYGFPYALDNNVTIIWDYTDALAKTAHSNLVYKVYTGSNGQFSTTFVVPSSVGGAHDVSAVSNKTKTYANATFTIIAQLTITPASPTNNGTEVTITGSGLTYPAYYDLCIDYTKDFFSNSSAGYPKYFSASSKGELAAFKIVVGVGFNAGTHVIALYKLTTGSVLPTLETYKLFTVVGEAETAIMDKLDEISLAIDELNTYVSSSSTGIPSVKTLLTAIQTAVGDARTALSTQITGLSSSLTSIETYAQTAATAATSASSAAQAASTAASGAKTSADAAASTASTISTSVYLCIVVALVAAVAAIFAVITLQRKVA